MIRRSSAVLSLVLATAIGGAVWLWRSSVKTASVVITEPSSVPVIEEARTVIMPVEDVRSPHPSIANKPSEPSREPQLQEFPNGDAWTLDVPLHSIDPVTLRVVKRGCCDYVCTLLKGGNETTVSHEWEGGLSRYAIVQNAGRETLLTVCEDGGSGYTSTELSIFNPAMCAFVSLTIGFSHSPLYPEYEQQLSDNAGDPRCGDDVAWLNGLKRRFGYVDAQDLQLRRNDPDLAFYFWGKDNLPLGNSPVKFRYYEGPPSWSSSVEESIENAGIVYTAYFKAGVVAYDRAHNRHWVIYQPEEYYSWPVTLLRYDRYLIIGTRYGGVVVFDLETNRLREYKVGDGDVERLAVVDAQIVVNGTGRVLLPR